MLNQLLTAIPDAYTGDDGVIRIIYEIEAGQFENLYLATQLLLEDMFVTTASYTALTRHGEQYGVPMKIGTPSSGQLTFSGSAGTFIPAGTQAAYDPGGGLDPIFFDTIGDGTIPSLGTLTPPVISAGTSPGLTGTYEYVVTFVTADGETLPSNPSNFLAVSNVKVNLTGIPTGAAGLVTKRRLYRDKNGTGTYRFVAEIADNTTTTYTDNIADATVAAAQAAPTVDSATVVTVNAVSEEIGVSSNVVANTVTVLANVPATLTAVTNPVPFTGGSDPEDSEEYRQRLLDVIQNPDTGSVGDIQSWALSVEGVETATVFENTPVAGTVTVMITGPGGTVPPDEVKANVLNVLNAQGYANISFVVSSFTPLSTNVTVATTLDPAWPLATITPSVQAAISDYINSLGVGQTMYLSGIIDSVFGLVGILDVTVTTPTTNQTTPAGQKRVPGTITVT